MQAKKSILALAVAGLMAATGAALAYGPGPHAGMGMMGPRGGAPLDPAQQAERVQFRLAGLKDALKLQPNQLEAWSAYESKVKSAAAGRAQMRQSMFEQRGDAQAMADQRVAMMKLNAQAAEEVNTVRKALVATLSAEQKATFERLSFGGRFARGPGAQGGPQGYGPGHGPGPGFGRGCVGAV